jgi:TRAP-type C4-dicarboxylate transport system permease small subunit
MSSRPETPPDPSAPPARGVLLEELLAVACMVLLVLLTLANVIVRYFTDESFAATEEISIALMVVMTIAGASAAAARDRHMRVEYFYAGGSAARRRLLAAVSAAVSVIFFVLLGLLSARVVWDEVRYEETSMALGVPRWWYSIWVPLLCFVIAARAAVLLRRVHRGQALAGGDAADASADRATPGDGASR